MGRLVPRAYFAPLRGRTSDSDARGILARGAEPLADPPDEAQTLFPWGSEHEEEVHPRPNWEVGVLPPQSPHLSRPKELRWRGRADRGAPSHLNSNDFAVRIARQQIHLEAPDPKVARKDYPAAGRQRAGCQRLCFAADECPLPRRTCHHRIF